MPLEEREQELYRRNARKIPRPAEPRTRKAAPAPKAGGEWGKVEALPPPIVAPGTSRRIGRLALWSIVTLVILSGIGFGLFKWWSAPNVTLDINGAQEIRSGERASYEIVLENSARSAIERAYFTISAGTGVILPETSERILRAPRGVSETMTIEPGAIRRERFSAYFLGREGDEREIEVKLYYRLPNIASEFVQTETYTVKITGSSLTLALTTPKQALANTNFSFGLEWKNVSDLTILYFGAEFEYPDDFSFVRSDPVPQEGDAWQYDALMSQATGTVSVTGRLSAEAGMSRTLNADLFTRVRGEKIILAETSSDIAIIENPLIMSMSVNGENDYIAKPDETLEYVITFKNNYGESLKNIVIAAQLSGTMFDMRSVRSDGAFDSRTNTVTFHGGNTPQLLFLDPQESGSVTFRVTLRDTIPATLRNAAVTVTAAMSSQTQPRFLGIEGAVSAETSLETKITGVLSLARRALLRDALYGSAAVGPWPLTANATTRFGVHWTVRTQGNGAKNISVSTILPAGVVYAGNARGDITGTQVVANPRTNAVEWQIPNLSAFASKEFVFQIEVTPSSPDIGNPMTLLGAVNLVGTDSATGEKTEFATDPLRSDSLDDPTIADPSLEGIVRP